MKIKVCGLKKPENILCVGALEPDFIGFIFYPKSPRFVGNDVLIPEVNSTVKKVGVFVNEYPAIVIHLAEKHGLDLVQLHGNESVEACKQIRNHIPVIKAFPVQGSSDFDRCVEYVSHVDYFLFDTKTSGYGGSGKNFDWKLMDQYSLDKPFFLSGGIGPEDLEEIKHMHHPYLYGVDINSRFETKPGIKNTERIHLFLNKLRYEQHIP